MFKRSGSLTSFTEDVWWAPSLILSDELPGVWDDVGRQEHGHHPIEELLSECCLMRDGWIEIRWSDCVGAWQMWRFVSCPSPWSWAPTVKALCHLLWLLRWVPGLSSNMNVYLNACILKEEIARRMVPLPHTVNPFSELLNVEKWGFGGGGCFSFFFLLLFVLLFEMRSYYIAVAVLELTL